MTGVDCDYIPDVVSEITSSPIELNAVLIKASTTPDGGWRLTFDVGNDETAKVLMLSCLRSELLRLEIVKNS